MFVILAPCAPAAASCSAQGVVILRPTRKLRPLLAAAAVSRPGDTALGDWYVNRLVVDRQPLLLLVSSTSLLPMLVPARDVRGLADRLSNLVAARLRRMGIEAGTIAREQAAMSPVVVAPTVDRSVLGIMVDFAKTVPFHLEPGQWNLESLAAVEDRLAETPCYAGRPGDGTIFPDQRAPALLRAKWASDAPPPAGSSLSNVVH